VASLRYDPAVSDSLVLIVGLDRQGPPPILHIDVPQSVKIAEESWRLATFWKAREWRRREGRREYIVEPTEENEGNDCHVEFRGRLFGSSPVADVHFSLDVWLNGGVVEVPLEVSFLGTPGFAMDQLVPAPQERYPTFARYRFESTRDEALAGGISLLGVDRRRLALRDFWLFGLAALFGVLTSTLVSGIFVMVAAYEDYRLAQGAVEPAKVPNSPNHGAAQEG
jgi:hypothetical protein